MRVALTNIQKGVQYGGVEEGDAAEIDLERVAVEGGEPLFDTVRAREVAFASHRGATIDDHQINNR